jgi:hypothetical protein
LRLSIIAMMPALALAALPGVAEAWTASNRSEVTPLGSNFFEVVNRNTSRAQGFWSAAGEYAIVALRRSAVQRNFVHIPLCPSQTSMGADSVIFSLSPPPGGPAPQSYSLSVRIACENLTAAAGRQFCLDRLPIS